MGKYPIVSLLHAHDTAAKNVVQTPQFGKNKFRDERILLASRSTSQTISPSLQVRGDARTFSVLLLSSVLYHALPRARIRDASGSSVRASSRRPDMVQTRVSEPR
jgi:hypothetical protein